MTFSALLFFIPLKLSLSYIFFFPLLISGWIYLISSGKFLEIQKNFGFIFQLWLFFIIILLITAGFGLNTLNSFMAISKLLLYSSIVPVFFYLLSTGKLASSFLFLFAGQSIAACHSILEFFYPDNFQQIFVGTVSESGQLSLVILLLTGFLFAASKNRVYSNPNKRTELLGLLYLIVMLLLCITALLLNLKRGPIAGVLVAVTVFLFQTKPKLLLAFIPSFIASMITFEPLRERILNSLNHFLITGGRKDIWEVGVELAGRYPLGIGFHNSSVVHEYSSVIPPELRHFHSNYINVLVEGGLLSLVLFVWFWSIAVFKKYRTSIPLASSCAIIAWIIAGTVEYNFGDSEVMMITYLALASAFYESVSLSS